MTGVIPVIFAATLMAFPPTAGQLIRANWAQHLAAFFNPNGWPFVTGESLLILVFTFFYTAVTFNPVDQANNLKKHGGFIAGIRPGRPTATFLDRVLARLAFRGAIYLAAIAALPTVLIAQTRTRRSSSAGHRS
jgi:preprotein translocase subunit SecY